MTRHSQTLTGLIAVALLALAVAGCSASTSSPGGTTGSHAPRSDIPDPAPGPAEGPTAPSIATDPCAERLHALCGPLLYYYALNRRMPERLEELRNLGGPEPDIELTCPVSGKPYAYDPKGLPRGGKPGVLVLYDAAPSHSGLRWAVAVEPPKAAGQPLIPQVVAEQELLFQTPRE